MSDSFESRVRMGSVGEQSIDPNVLASLMAVQFPAVGCVLAYGGSVAPTGYLLCNGGAHSRTRYPDLFQVIGTNFGAGDGSTTFNVPDLSEAYPVGVGTRASGVTGHDAFALGEFKDDQVQAHLHGYTNGGNVVQITGGSGAGLGTGASFTQSGTTATLVADGANGTPRKGTVTRGKGLGLNFIIKAWNTNSTTINQTPSWTEMVPRLFQIGGVYYEEGKWYAYTPTLTGFGTGGTSPTNVSFSWKREGGSLIGSCDFTAGTNTATEARASLPLSLVSDSTVIPRIRGCGSWQYGVVGANSIGAVLIESGVGYVTFGFASGTTNPLNKINGNLLNNNVQITMFFEIPTSGWN